MYACMYVCMHVALSKAADMFLNGAGTWKGGRKDGAGQPDQTSTLCSVRRVIPCWVIALQTHARGLSLTPVHTT